MVWHTAGVSYSGSPRAARIRLSVGKTVMKLMSQEELLRLQLEALTQEHHRLNALVDDAARAPYPALELQRMKKRKLQLRDRITELRDRLDPDIIA